MNKKQKPAAILAKKRIDDLKKQADLERQEIEKLKKEEDDEQLRVLNEQLELERIRKEKKDAKKAKKINITHLSKPRINLDRLVLDSNLTVSHFCMKLYELFHLHLFSIYFL